MAENLTSKESKEIKFNRHDLTPFEHAIIGSSVDVPIGGNILCFNSKLLEELKKDKEALKVILTPISLTEGKRTLEEVHRARMHGETFSGLLVAFKDEQQFKYMDEKKYLTFKPGELDENGQLKTFGIYLSQNKQKIDLPEKAHEEIVIEDKFKDLIKYTGNADGVIKYRISLGEEK